MGDEGADPEVRALTDRIAAVQAAIEEVKEERARIERTQTPAEDAAEAELAALREEMRVGFAAVEGKIDRRFTDLMKWSLLFSCGAVAVQPRIEIPSSPTDSSDL